MRQKPEFTELLTFLEGKESQRTFFKRAGIDRSLGSRIMCASFKSLDVSVAHKITVATGGSVTLEQTRAFAGKVRLWNLGRPARRPAKRRAA